MLGKTFGQYKLKIIKDQKPIPLDYVMVLPSKITEKIKQKTRKKMLSDRHFQSEILPAKHREHQREHGQIMN